MASCWVFEMREGVVGLGLDHIIVYRAAFRTALGPRFNKDIRHGLLSLNGCCNRVKSRKGAPRAAGTGCAFQSPK
jgi:hypothetical protein